MLLNVSAIQQWVLFGLIALVLRAYWNRNNSWVNVPVIGSSGILSSYVSAIQTFRTSKVVLREGYAKYIGKGRFFQVADFHRWHVFACGPELVDELLKMPDEVLSPEHAHKEVLQTDHLFGKTTFSNPYHANVVRHQLTRNLAALFPGMMDEMRASFTDEIPASDGWVSIKAHEAFMRVICRISNRTFVGLPLCRNKDFVELNIKYTIDVAISSQILRFFPKFTRGFIAKWLTPVHYRAAKASKFLLPLITERYKLLKESENDWNVLPKDLLTWLMQSAQGVECQPRYLCDRILVVNFGAIHTSSVLKSFTWFLYHIAAYPSYVPVLREEIQNAINELGWSKLAMTKCKRLDSFIKETMRVKPMAAMNVGRLARRDITLSDGTTIPTGALVSSAMEAQHHDPRIYGETAEEFDGFRFSNARDTEKESLKHQIVYNNTEFHLFGAGRHACPGRFFAANELKALASHAIIHYDIKFEDASLKPGQLPAELWYGMASMPDASVKLLFKRRVIASLSEGCASA